MGFNSKSNLADEPMSDTFKLSDTFKVNKSESDDSNLLFDQEGRKYNIVMPLDGRILCQES